MLAALAMVREKESGTILQVYASSITAVEFIGGKVIAYLIVGIAEALFLLFIAGDLFQPLIEFRRPHSVHNRHVTLHH